MTDEALQFHFPEDPKAPTSLCEGANREVYEAILENIVTPQTSNQDQFNDAVEKYLDLFFTNKRTGFYCKLQITLSKIHCSQQELKLGKESRFLKRISTAMKNLWQNPLAFLLDFILVINCLKQSYL